VNTGMALKHLALQKIRRIIDPLINPMGGVSGNDNAAAALFNS
jgi:hypothetical protein